MLRPQKRYQIGVLLPEIGDLYHNRIRKEINKAATRRPWDVSFFVGYSYLARLQNYEATSNEIYRQFDPRQLDGLIVVSSSLFSFSTEEEAQELLARYESLPLVCMGLPVKGYPSVSIKQDRGIYQAVDHLINHHNYHKFGIILGPPLGKEPVERTDYFKKALNKMGCRLHPDFIWNGNFQEESGREGILHFAQKNLNTLDAIICENDSMAIGAVTELQKQGIKVPEDIAVVGFDDVENMAAFDPPLSTIRQPLDQLVEKTLQNLGDQIQGRPIFNIELKTEFIRRQSCGCPPSPGDQLAARKGPQQWSASGIFWRSYLNHKNELANCRTYTEMEDKLATILQLFGVAGCGIVLLKGDKSELKFFVGINSSVETEVLPFPSTQILPEEYQKALGATPRIIRPICFQEDFLGYMIFLQGKAPGMGYEHLSSMISTTVISIEQLQKQRESEEELSRIRRIESMTRMISDMAHEINTPLGTAILGLSWIEENLPHWDCGKDKETALSFLHLTTSSLDSINSLISRIRDLSFTSAREEASWFNLNQVFQNCQNRLESLLSSGDFDLNVQCPPDLEILSFPIALCALGQELILNSLNQLIPSKTRPQIKIAVEQEADQIRIRYRDNRGKGPDKSLGRDNISQNLISSVVQNKLRGEVDFSYHQEGGFEILVTLPRE